jgi:DNA-binding PadR family transcriptional regulator
MVRRKVSNPLALAVLATLSERSMHPYELAAILKERGKEQSIRINYGSLYTVVDALSRAGFIEPVETLREGRRPERTVYAITPTGRVELTEWLSEILCTSKKEFPEFEAGLSLLPVLPPERVVGLLKLRIESLKARIASVQKLMEQMRSFGLRRLMVIEAEYEEALLRAELQWVRGLVEDIEEGRHEDLPAWHRWHDGTGTGRSFALREEFDEQKVP